MTWSEEIRALGSGQNNRDIRWCAEELLRATERLVFDYLQFLAALRARRRLPGHRYNFNCCRGAR